LPPYPNFYRLRQSKTCQCGETCLILFRNRQKGLSFFSENIIGTLFFFVISYIIRSRRINLPKHAGVYKGEKRRKEVSRQKKQEERRQRRLNKGDQPSSATEETETVEQKEPAHP
jgi:hypothetical protein